MASTSSYQSEEVEALVNGYIELHENRSVSNKRMWILVRMMDVDEALLRLEPVLREALFYRGIVGFTDREAAALLQVHHSTVQARYELGIARLTTILNGGTT